MSAPDGWVRVDHVPGPPARESTWWFRLAGAGALVAAGLGWHLLREPANWPWGLLIGSLLTVQVVCSLVHDTWLDPDGGRVVHRRVRLLRWEVPWAEADVVRLRHNFMGVVMLQLRRRGGLLSVYVPVVADDDRGPRGQPPEVLRLLTTGLRRWGRPEHHPVADALDAQADHLEAGGGFLDSPVMVRHDGFRIG